VLWETGGVGGVCVVDGAGREDVLVDTGGRGEVDVLRGRVRQEPVDWRDY